MRAVSMLALVAACSWVGAKPPHRSWEPSQPTECVTSDISPVLDGLVGIGAAVLAVSAISSLTTASGYAGGCRYGGEELEKPNRPSCELIYPVIAIGTLVAGGLSYSAWHGVKRNRACKRARSAHREWVLELPSPAIPAAVPDAGPSDGGPDDGGPSDAGLAPDPVDASVNEPDTVTP